MFKNHLLQGGFLFEGLKQIHSKFKQSNGFSCRNAFCHVPIQTAHRAQAIKMRYLLR